MPQELAIRLQKLLLEPLEIDNFAKLSDSDSLQLFSFLISKQDVIPNEKRAFGLLYSCQKIETRLTWIMDAITEDATWTISYILEQVIDSAEISSLYDALEINSDPNAAIEVYQSALDTPVPEQLAGQMIDLLELRTEEDPSDYLLNNRSEVTAAIARMNSAASSTPPPLFRHRSSEEIPLLPFKTLRPFDLGSSTYIEPARLSRQKSSEEFDFSSDDEEEVPVSVAFQSPRVIYSYIRGKFIELPIASPWYSIRDSEVIGLILEAHLEISRSRNKFRIAKEYSTKLKALLGRYKPFLQEASAALTYAIKFDLEEMFFILLECGANPFLSVQGVDSAYDLAFTLYQKGLSYYLESFIELGIYPSPPRYSTATLKEQTWTTIFHDMNKHLIINFEGEEVDAEAKNLLQTIFRCLNSMLADNQLTTLDSKRKMWLNILIIEKNTHPRVKPFFESIMAVLGDDTQTQETLKEKIDIIDSEFVSKVTTPQFSLLALNVFQNPTPLLISSAFKFHIPQQHQYNQQVAYFNLVRLTWFDVIMRNPVEIRFQLTWTIPIHAQTLPPAQKAEKPIAQIEWIERVKASAPDTDFAPQPPLPTTKTPNSLAIKNKEPAQHSPSSLNWYIATYQLTYARHSFTYIFTEAIPLVNSSIVDYYLSNNFFWGSLRLGSATILTFSHPSETIKILSVLSTECIITVQEISYNYAYYYLQPYLGDFFTSFALNSFVAIATTITLSPIIYIPFTSALLTSTAVTMINYQTHHYENNLELLSQAAIVATSSMFALDRSQLIQPSDSHMTTFSKAMIFANAFALAHKTTTCIALTLQDSTETPDLQDYGISESEYY